MTSGLINTLGDVHDPTQLSEIWDHDVYRARGHLRGGCVIDVGANVGAFTIWALTHGAASVVAVEPFVENVTQLRKNLERTGFTDAVTVIEAAAADRVGTCEVIVGGPEGSAERSTGSHTVAGSSTPTIDLRTVIGDRPSIDVLKVDCEGGEYPFFATARSDDMRRVRYVAIEFHVWREHGSPIIPGVGERTGAMAPDAPERLFKALERTHVVTVQGDLAAGGYLFGELR